MGESGEITVRALRRDELDRADRIMRLAFGIFIGLAEPLRFLGDGDYVRSRFHARHDAAFAAEVGGRLAGSNFATRWGSFATVGPLTVDPALWDRGIASRLMEPVCALLDRWDVSLAGLFTFAHSARHLGLYQKFGFRPRALTLLLSRPLSTPVPRVEWQGYSALDEQGRARAREACAVLCAEIFAGLDPGTEIASIAEQGLGDTVLVYEHGRLAGFATCHAGQGSEAGSGACYVKFAALAPGKEAPARLSRLLAACAEFARARGATVLRAGVNAARDGAYERMLDQGFGIERSGVAMHRPNAPGFNRADAFVLDDWR